MHVIRLFIVSLFMFAQASNGLLATPHHKVILALAAEKISADSYQLTVSGAIPAGDCVHADSLQLFVDNPDVHVSAWDSSAVTNTYDHQFHDTKPCYVDAFTLSSTAQLAPNTSDIDTHLHISYYQHAPGKFIHELMPLSLQKPTDANTPPAPHMSAHQEQNVSACPIVNPCEPSFIATLFAKFKELSKNISNLFLTTDSFFLRIIFCFLLGLLFSLTPCIYPMIPITIGILQAQKKGTVLQNLLLALSYTLGVSCTFALLGIFATATEQLFGNFMTKPVVILVVVALILYLAFAMIGFYDMYLPRFLQTSRTNHRSSSFASAFLFGAASGTVASPCLSPGLVVLLTFVSTLKNYVVGFTFLFSFGIGLSVPLLVIGTFSNSLTLLPRAGMWMVEVKRLLGILMIATCFYFLKNILSATVLYNLAAATLLAISVMVFYFAHHSRSWWRYFYQMLGTALVVFALITGLRICQNAYCPVETSCPTDTHINWVYNYQEAREKARQENKKLFMYATAPFCTLCSTIEQSILADKTIVSLLEKTVTVKIDISAESRFIGAVVDSPADFFVALVRKKYGIIGVPVYLLINPETEEVLGRWGSELYDEGVSYFHQQLVGLL